MQFTYLIPKFLLILSSYKYILLFLGVIFEGPILMVASGFLVLLGFFNPFYAFPIIMAGDLLGDVIWYYIGYFFADPFLKKYGRIFMITPEIFEKAKDLFHKNQTKILFFSKITIGFGMALTTLMAAGASHIPFKKYISINLVGEIILVSIFMGIGYFFGEIIYSYVPYIKN